MTLPTPRALLRWATEEMQFQSSCGSLDLLLPSEKDFEKLFKPPLSEVWTYVIRHIKATETIKKVKGNLAIQKHLALDKVLKRGRQVQASGQEDVDSELGQLVKEKARLLAELTSCQSEVDMLTSEMEHIKTDINTTEIDYQRAIESIRNLQKKDNLLQVVQAHGEENVDRYTEYNRRVVERTNNIIKKRTHIDEILYSTGKGEETETQCCRDVRLACEEIGKFLKQAISGKCSDKSLDKLKQDVHDRVETLMTPYSAGHLVESLTSNTVTAASHTREETVSLNIQRDVQQLRFSFSSGGLKDMSVPPTVQESVHQLLQDSNMEHIMRWFKEQEYKNDSWKLEARLDDHLAEINKLVQKCFGEQPERHALAKHYINALITLAIERSVVPCAREVIADLEGRRDRAQREREELRVKHEQIQNFRTLVDRKQAVIARLAQQNSGAAGRLAEQRQQVGRFIAEHASLSSHSHSGGGGGGGGGAEMKALSDSLRNSLSEEVERFSQAVLPALLTVTLDPTSRLSVLDLSLAPSLHPTNCRRTNFYTNVCAALGFPSFKSVDALPEHVLGIHRDIQTKHWEEQMRLHYIKTAKHVAQADDDVDGLIGLCEQIWSHEKKQNTKLLPELQRYIKATDKHTEEAKGIQQLVQTWWDQPAQHLTPWVTTEGLTFNQWMRRLKTAVAARQHASYSNNKTK